jgi:hypothetical protein
MLTEESRRFDCSYDYSVERYKSRLPLKHSSVLYYCEANITPNFRGESGANQCVISSNSFLVKLLCELDVNHRDMPASAFKLRTGVSGNKFYRVSYELELNFGSELLFTLAHDGRVIGSVTANYH